VTAKRSKTKNSITGEMANQAVLEPSEAAREEEEDERSLRRPPEPIEGKGLWAHVEQGARIAASIGVAGAAIFGVIEYNAANEDVRRERSMGFVEAWQNARQIDRYTRVQAFVEDKLNSGTAPLATMPPEALTRSYANLGYNWIVDLREQGGTVTKGIEADVDRLTLFFSQMEICVASDLCNASVLEAYFESEVVSFWRYFQGYAKLRREANYEGYGKSVNDLVDRFKTPGRI